MGCGASKTEGGVEENKQQQQQQQQQPQQQEDAAAPAPSSKRNSAAAPAADAAPAAADAKPAEEAAAAPAANRPAAEKEEKTRDDRKTAWETIKAALPRAKTAEDKARRIELWKQFDQNATGRLSLAEVDGACRNILKLDDFTSRLSSILIRAFNKANGQGGNRGSADYVEFLEFRLLLCYIYDYFELQVMFDEVDSSDDNRISLEEFEKAAPLIEKWGLKLTDPAATFKEVDADNAGMILFSEFAEWASAKKLDADGDPDNEE